MSIWARESVGFLEAPVFVREMMVAYLWLSLHTTKVIVEKLHLTVGERGGGCFRRHCCGFESRR
jgi:hypothetical protein